jgi:glutathione S-transferase
LRRIDAPRGHPMKLYTFPAAPYSRKPQVAAYEKGIAVDQEIVVPFEPTDMERFRDQVGIPLAQLPLLRLDDGRFLRESSLIAEYFDLMGDGEPRLLPEDRLAALEVRAMDKFADGILQPITYLVWAMRKPPNPDTPRKIASARETFFAAMRQLDSELADKKYICGPRFTLADISVACAIGTIDSWASFEDLSPYPRLVAWFQHTSERPAWRRVVDESKPFLNKLPPPLRTAF